MDKKFIIKFLVLFVLLSVFPVVHCNNLKTKNEGLIRLIDRLKASNVISTPFTDVIKNFELIKEDLSGKLDCLHELSTSKQKVWAATTSNPILSGEKNAKPHGMEVFINSNKINHLEESDMNSVRWKWIDTARDVDFRDDEKFRRIYNCLIIDEEDSYSFDTFFPGAQVELEISARRNWHPVDMQIYFNDKLVAKEKVKKTQELFNISQNPPAGMYRITIKSSVSERIEEKKKPTPPRLLIYRIQVKTQNDLILFFVPSNLQSDFLSNAVKTQYHSGKTKPSDENKYLHLYNMKHDFILDKFDQKVNPENIKKNIVLDNLSLDVLMAPPKTEFEFKLNIPPKSFLEFGIGIFSYQKISTSLLAKFKIIIELDKIKTVLYEKIFHLNPGNKKEQLIFKKIDLTPFAKKKIKLTFITEKPEGSESIALSFWSNPVIYQSISESSKIILISLDTLRADHLGCYGYNRATSPNIDDFANDSVLFENVYAQSPWTLPSHISMLFSLNSANHQVYYDNQKIDSSLPSLASHLKNHGYLTYAFTGGGYVSSLYGFSKGFDWYDEPVGGKYAPLDINEAEKLFNNTSGWLKNNQNKQFFLFLHTYQTHGPYNCPSPWNEMFLDNNSTWKKLNLKALLETKGNDKLFTPEEIQNIIDLYDGEIRYTDEMLIKPLLSLLKETGIYNDSLIIITSDHGEEFFDHKGWLHGHNLYDEQIRVPLLIKFPHSEFKGKKIKTKCRLIDIMPTVLETVSVKYKKSNLDGKNLIDLILGKEIEDRIFISDLSFKNVHNPLPVLVATNRKDIKLILEKSAQGIKNIEIFDLSKDPKEKNNIFRKQRKLGQEIIKSIDDYYRNKLRIQRKKELVILDEKLKEKLRALGYLK